MFILVALLCFLSIFLLLYALVIAPREIEEAAVKERVQSLGVAQSAYVDEMDKGLIERLLKPLSGKIVSLVKNNTPQQIYNNVLKQADLVSEELRWGVNGFIVVWFLTITAVTLISSYYFFIVNSINPLRALVVVFVSSILGALIPILYLRYLIAKRQQTMLENLPDILDLLAVSVQAGLGLDGALQKVVEKVNNPLSREMQRMLRELRLGMTRRQALERLADRCGILEISIFASAIIQSDRMGVGIAHVIEVQADNMRNKKMQIIKEKAAKMPLKLLFPLIIFIFPTVFIVVLGPRLVTVLNIMLK